MPKSKKQATGDATPESPATDKKQASTAEIHGWEPVPANGKPKRGRPRKEAAVEEKAAPTPAREKKPKPAPKAPAIEPEPAELVVFAFRLTQAEREEIHNAVAPSKASRFVRAIAIAAARHDMAGIKTAIIENQRTAAA
jgi:hypothetical protein